MNNRTILSAVCCLLLHLSSVGCGDAPILDLKIVTPEGADPFTGADTVRLLVSNPASEHSVTVTDPGSFTLELEVAVESAAGTITLEALSSQKMVARGETPPMILRPEEQQLSLLVARAGELSLLKPRLGASASHMASTLLPSRGVLMAGGQDSAGAAVATAALYNFFQHKLETISSLPAPRAGAVAAYCGATCGVVALGGDGKTLASTMLRYDGATWAEYKDGLDAATRRRDAGIASLADGSYLVAGGAGVSGAQDTFLRLRPGTVSSAPSMEALPARARAARQRPAMAAGTGSVLIAGGQTKGKPACEIFFLATLSSQTVTLPGTTDLAGGAAAATLKDGRVALVGGRDSAGTLLRDAWIVDPSTLTVTHVKGALTTGRADHRLMRIDNHLLVLGGVVGTSWAAEAEVLDGSTLKGIKQITMQAPRSGFVTQHLGIRGAGDVRSLLVAGGVDAGGTVNELEVYQSSTPLN